MFADRLKYLRRAKGLTQVELAMKLGVKKQSVSNWENDNIVPSVEMLEKIATFFRVSTDYLLGRDDLPNDGIKRFGYNGFNTQEAEHIRAIVDDIRKRT